MKAILYATDFSDNAVAALKYAHQLSVSLNYRLVVCHIFGLPIIGDSVVLDDIPKLQKKAKKATRVKLEKFCSEHLGKDWRTKNLQIEPVENSTILNGILDTANNWHAEMIIVGMKGESKLIDLLFGTTTNALIQKAPCPVLAIPADASYMPIKRVVYATDFEEEDIHAIQKLVEFAEPLDAEIKIVHVSTRDEYAGDMQMEWFRDMLESQFLYSKIEFKLIFSDDIFDSLRIYLGDIGADLVVMLERKKEGFLSKLIHRDKVKKMESYGRVPLLSFNEHYLQTFYYNV
ncbi:universal stress protein [Maribacter sp. CXY002]|uniref:universal stress protein n=1 Tax=Maribacter luteocoastalis TaxID=3407671 RepID=UPI003B67547B